MMEIEDDMYGTVIVSVIKYTSVGSIDLGQRLRTSCSI